MNEAARARTGIDRSHISPVTTREELIYLLSRACELEHGLACLYLFAAYSLKSDVQEGGVTEEQLDMIRDWKGQLVGVAIGEMLHLAQVSNMLTAIGGAPNFRRTNFPLPATAYPFGVAMTLEPFSEATIERFVTYELPEEGVLSPEEHRTYEEIRSRVIAAQGTLPSPLDDVVTEDGLEPFDVDFSTVGEFYHKIETGFENIPEEELFIGPPEAQANGLYVDLGSDLVAVVNRDASRAAIEMIIEQGEAPTGAYPDAHFVIFDTIRKQHAEVVAKAREAGKDFDPVRPVASNPMTRYYEDTSGGAVIRDPLTHEAADLFNVAYDTMLSMLMRFFARTEESDAELEHLSRTTLRLMTSVLRPLAEALTKMPMDPAGMPGVTAGPGFGYNRDVRLLAHKQSAWAFFGERLWQLAQASTKLRQNPGLPTEIIEATAALQDLACQFAPKEGPRSVEAKVAELRRLEAGLGIVIQSSLHGPYLATNVESLQDYLGVPIPTRPEMALCRCGASGIKPFCDGSHARIGFTGRKSENRTPDQLDAYAGKEITILDNRGVCAHSGFCTDRLSEVFRLRQEPWIDPDGAKREAILKAVKACPSGALGYALRGTERAADVDQDRPPAIEVSKDGPYRITGAIKLLDAHGQEEVPGAGSSAEHYSLCRCGQSPNKPFCTGMHWYVGFKDPQLPEDREPTMFEWVGGFPALTRLTTLFYEKYIPQDPLLAPLFANMQTDHPQRVAAWLGEVFGGPSVYDEKYGGYEHMLSQHLVKSLTETQRARWVALLTRAADEAGIASDAEFRSAFAAYIEWGSRLALENSTPGAHPPQHMSVPRWGWGVAGPPTARVSALASEAKEEAIDLPEPGEPVSFDKHIKPLFRTEDRDAMTWAFDLASYEDVSRHAAAICERIQDGSMPCDIEWPEKKMEVFKRWSDSGKAK